MTCECDNCEWKQAYEFEKQIHKNTRLMLQKAEEESIHAFISTRDMVEVMRSLNSRGTNESTSTYKPEYYGRRRDVNRRKDQ